MDVYALFSDRTVEKVLIDSFPSRETEKGLIFKTTISSAELKESATKSINNAYLLLEKSYKDIPKTIGVCVYGFSYNVIGNSADLAFATAFLVYLTQKGIINSCKPMPKTIAATGVITERLSISSVSNIKEKILAAADKKIEVVFYPYANQKEVEEIKKTDSEFGTILKKIRLVPITTLEDVLSEYGLLKIYSDVAEKKRVGLKFKLSFSIILFVLIVFVFVLFKSLNPSFRSLTAPVEEVSHKPDFSQTFNATNTPIAVLTPSPTNFEVESRQAFESETLQTPDNTKTVTLHTHLGLGGSADNNSPRPSGSNSKNDSEQVFDSNTVSEASTNITNSIGNTSGNLNNSGFVSSQGDFVYFTDPLNVGLYKMKHDGSYMTLVKSAFSTHINVIGDKIYYLDSRSRGLFVARTDGTEKRKINDDDIESICVSGEWVYYINSNDKKLYRVNKMGLDRTPLCNEFEKNSQIFSNNDFTCSHMSIDGKYIYFYAQFKNETDWNGIYRMNADGSDKRIVTRDECSIMLIENSFIYFVSCNDNCLYRIKSDGTAKEKIYGEIKTFNLSSGLIYFCNNDGIFKMDSGGDFISRITNDSTNKINIVGDWVYYLNLKDGNRLYRIKTNGSSKQPVGNSKTSDPN